MVGTGAISAKSVTDSNPWNATTPKPVPSITIVKGDVNGNAADSAPDAPDLGNEPASVGLAYTVTNDGNEALKNVVVTDQVVTNGTVTGLSCDFSALGGPSTGTTWAGPLAVGASFPCTAQLSGVLAGADHEDIGTVTGTGIVSGTDVTSTNPYYATATPLTPGVTIVKGDSDGNAADTADAAATLPTGTATLVYRVTNSGNDALKNVTVTDQVVSNGTVTGLSCDFSALGGPSTGTTWAGPLAVGASFPCTAQLSGVQSGGDHEDIGTVIGTGVVTGKLVTSSNPYYAWTPPPLITEVAGGGGLAATGSDLQTPLRWGVGLLASGLLTLVLAARSGRSRRRRQVHRA